MLDASFDCNLRWRNMKKSFKIKGADCNVR